jgi:predicted DNA-binding transcriptional regulator AlpA
MAPQLRADLMQAAPARLVNTKGASKITSLSESQLNKLRVYGGGPEYVKLGRSVLYEIEALEAWIAKHRRTSTSDRGETA